MNLEDKLDEEGREEMNEAVEKSKQEKEKAARKKRRAKTKYGSRLNDE